MLPSLSNDQRLIAGSQTYLSFIARNFLPAQFVRQIIPNPLKFPRSNPPIPASGWANILSASPGPGDNQRLDRGPSYQNELPDCPRSESAERNGNGIGTVAGTGTGTGTGHCHWSWEWWPSAKWLSLYVGISMGNQRSGPAFLLAIHRPIPILMGDEGGCDRAGSLRRWSKTRSQIMPARGNATWHLQLEFMNPIDFLIKLIRIFISLVRGMNFLFYWVKV